MRDARASEFSHAGLSSSAAPAPEHYPTPPYNALGLPSRGLAHKQPTLPETAIPRRTGIETYIPPFGFSWGPKEMQHTLPPGCERVNSGGCLPIFPALGRSIASAQVSN